jgi:hypothetical protein
LSKTQNGKWHRPKKVYFLTLDAATEIASSENTEAGREILCRLLEQVDRYMRADPELERVPQESMTAECNRAVFCRLAPA